MENTLPKGGHIIVGLSPKTFLAGAETGIKYEVRLPSGDWFKFPTLKEYQYKDGSFDSNSCTTFSALNIIEMQVNWLVANNLIPADKLAFLKAEGYFADGTFNCSDWFTAIMSGTTSYGNDFESVWNSIRKHGLLPQVKGYAPKDFNTIEEWLDKSKITAEHKADALKVLEVLEFSYEMILTGFTNPDVVAYHLKHAPIHLATPVCAGWGTDSIIKTCNQPTQHATAAHGSEQSIATLILDHYDPTNKKLAWDYPTPWACKGVVTVKKSVAPTPKPKYVFTRTMQKGSTGAEVEMLQRALKSLGFYKLNHFTQYFGDWTDSAVRAFQTAYASEILAPWGLTMPTGKVATTTRKKLNELLNS